MNTYMDDQAINLLRGMEQATKISIFNENELLNECIMYVYILQTWCNMRKSTSTHTFTVKALHLT